MLALAAFVFAIQKADSSSEPDRPVFLMYWQAGMVYPRPADQVCIAVWSDGKIIWREPFAVTEMKPRWHKTSAKYFQGQISASSVTKELAAIKGLDFDRYRDWGPVAPDTDTMHMVVRRGNKVTELMMTPEFEFSFDGTQPPEVGSDRFKEGWKVWRTVRAQLRQLVPAKRKTIPIPNSATIDSWTRMPPFPIKH